MNKNDKELLELAARAVKLDAFWSIDGSFVVKSGGGMGTMPFEHEWNPLKNDGDALRLVVFLGLMVRCYHNCIVVEGDLASVDIEIGQCRYHTTRRAIVKAAAQIGAKL